MPESGDQPRQPRQRSRSRTDDRANLGNQSRQSGFQPRSAIEPAPTVPTPKSAIGNPREAARRKPETAHPTLLNWFQRRGKAAESAHPTTAQRSAKPSPDPAPSQLPTRTLRPRSDRTTQSTQSGFSRDRSQPGDLAVRQSSTLPSAESAPRSAIGRSSARARARLPLNRPSQASSISAIVPRSREATQQSTRSLSVSRPTTDTRGRETTRRSNRSLAVTRTSGRMGLPERSQSTQVRGDRAAQRLSIVPVNPTALAGSDARTQRLARHRAARERARQQASANRSGLALKREATDTKPKKPPRPRSRGEIVAMYAARMVIFSIGISVLAGTILSVWDPASRPTAIATLQTAAKTKTGGDSAQAAATPPAPTLVIGQEIGALKSAVQTLVNRNTAQNPDLGPTVFLFDLDTNGHVDVNGSAAIAAASTIKIPILVAFLQDVDAGKIRLDELLTLKKELIGSGSGEIQYLPPGTQMSALEVATKMSVISDNTATNLIIARMGGLPALNQRFKSWGMTGTTMRNLLPDLEGTNLTTAKDLTLLMARVSQGELLSPRSRDRLLDIMRKTVNNSLLPHGLSEGTTIAHKTGDIGTALGDVGLIDLPNGKRYALGVLVKRPFNDGQAGELIQQVSRVAHQHFTRPATAAAPTAPGAPENSSPANEAATGDNLDAANEETLAQ